MEALLSALKGLEAWSALAADPPPGQPALAAGLAGSAKAVLAAALFAERRRTLLVITSTTGTAEGWYSDLHALWRGESDELAPPLRLFPALTTLLYDDAGVDRQLVGQRLEAMEALLRGEPAMVVAPLAAVLHRTIPRAAMAGSDLELVVGQPLAPEALLARLVELGYVRHDPVLQAGHCALRGGIVDVFAMTAPAPLRVEFFGDEIESIRFFDVNSQRSTAPQTRFTITVSRESVRTRALDAEAVAAINRAVEHQAGQLEAASRGLEARRLRARVARDLRRLEAEEPFDGSEHYLPFLYDEVATILDYLPPEALVLVDEPAALALRGSELAREIDEIYRTKLAGGAVLEVPAPLYQRHDPQRPLWRGQACLELTAEDSPSAAARFETRPLPAFRGDLGQAMAAVAEWRAEHRRLVFLTHQVGRLRQILLTRGLGEARLLEPDELPEPGQLGIIDQRLTHGFELPTSGLCLLTDQEVFGWRRSRLLGGRSVARRGSTALASLTELAVGDLVVHIHHGVGTYAGLVTRAVGEVERDFLQIDYAGTDRLFVPVTELDRVQKYIGPEGKLPGLNALGDSKWRRTAAKARQKAQETARALLKLYARRSQAAGRAFSPETRRQQAMEAAFLYEETPDQLSAIAEIKADMERPVPMDRLLVGDVGFGKTEVAVRAAFKAVEDGCQVAVLAPTTILAQQHYTTFVERLGPFEVNVEVLSRFRTRREQQEVIEGLRAGTVQVVVGTHRLLSEDVRFADLGLLVIDEEQRFGVRHKERIKDLRTGVDVLTMTATPIPRTLNAATIGVRDLSVLQTPPQGRLPVRITVGERREDRVREALLRELERDGQIYFLHNRVNTIERLAQQIRRLVPTARVGVGHGQMSEDELEEVMVEMYAGRFDVLVCTTIIENGLDIPNVNTIFVDDCDRFGLAQLYQLCGRVGRRERQAYAYLLHRQHKELTPGATERLEAITELSELGSGFQIALRDLEIRGAGNLVGIEQSGFLEEVGYELYTQMLSEAVQALLRGDAEPAEPTLLAELELPIKAGLPNHYVPDEKQRIDLYRRLSAVRDEAGTRDLEHEVRDRFGRLPQPARNLFRLVYLRLAADRAGVAAVKAAHGRLTVQFGEGQVLDPREMRILARSLQREVSSGAAPRVRLAREALSADLREPRRWEPIDAAESLVRVVERARREVGAGAE
jgi:transcription-repair coupling factor (superfamily II helicase)